MHNSKPLKYNITQRSIPEWYDLKLVAMYGFSLGKVTSGLFGIDLYKSIIQCGRAPNPFEAYATGGYKVCTPWRCPPAVSSETISLVENLYGNMDQIYNYITSRIDQDKFVEDQILGFKPLKKRKPDLDTVDSTPARKKPWELKSNVPLNTIVFKDSMVIKDYSDQSNISLIKKATDVLADLDSRFQDVELCTDTFIFDEVSAIDSEEDFSDVDPSFYED